MAVLNGFDDKNMKKHIDLFKFIDMRFKIFHFDFYKGFFFSFFIDKTFSRQLFFCSFVKIPFKKHDLIIPVERCFVK